MSTRALLLLVEENDTSVVEGTSDQAQQSSFTAHQQRVNRIKVRLDVRLFLLMNRFFRAILFFVFVTILRHALRAHINLVRHIGFAFFHIIAHLVSRQGCLSVVHDEAAFIFIIGAALIAIFFFRIEIAAILVNFFGFLFFVEFRCSFFGHFFDIVKFKPNDVLGQLQIRKVALALLLLHGEGQGLLEGDL